MNEYTPEVNLFNFKKLFIYLFLSFFYIQINLIKTGAMIHFGVKFIQNGLNQFLRKELMLKQLSKMIKIILLLILMLINFGQNNFK